MFARCVYDSTSKTTVTNIGATAGDEMCNLYLMYYTDDESHDYIDCGNQDDRQMTRQVDQYLKTMKSSPTTAVTSSEGKPESKSIQLPKKFAQKPFLGRKLNLDFPIGKNYILPRLPLFSRR